MIAVGGTPSDTAAAAEESAVAVAAPDAPQAAVVKTSLRFDEMDLASIDRQAESDGGVAKEQLQHELIARIAAAAGVDPAQVRITALSQGSLVVEFEIVVPPGRGSATALLVALAG